MRTSGSSATLKPIFTIGYEKTDIDSFIARLSAANIDMLVDVRELPLSRKVGFSKNGLAAALNAVGIKYMHVRALGDPKPGREAARAGNHDLFVEIYTEHIEGRNAQSALSDLAKSIDNKRICLACFERNHERCHRKIVAERLSELIGAPIQHIEV